MAGPARLDRLERVTDLVLVLLNTDQPLPLDSIALQVPGYPVERAARRQAFERDKRLLRDEGIPLRTVRLPGEEQYGYLIDREAFYLPDLALASDALPPRRPANFVSGFESMPVTFTPTAPVGATA